MFDSVCYPAWSFWLQHALVFFIGYVVGLYGYAQARRDAYRDFLNAQARRLGLLDVPQDTQ